MGIEKRHQFNEFAGQGLLVSPEYDLDGIVSSDCTWFVPELPSGGALYDIRASVDPDSKDLLAALANGTGKKLEENVLPRTILTRDGLAFSMGGKFPMILSAEHGVIFNDEELKRFGIITRNFGKGNGNPQRPRYFYQVELVHGSLLPGEHLDQSGKLTAGIELSTLQFDEIWGIIEAMRRENMLSDRAIRTMIKPYFKIQPVTNG